MRRETDGMTMQLMIRRDVAMEVWRYNGRQGNATFVGGGSGSKSNSILLVVRDSTPDCHAIACDRMRSRKKTLCRQLSEFLKMHREREAGQKVCLKCFFTTTVNRFHCYFFRLSQKGRNEKRDSFYTAKRVSSVHSVVTKHVWPYFQSRFPKTSSERVSS